MGSLNDERHHVVHSDQVEALSGFGDVDTDRGVHRGAFWGRHELGVRGYAPAPGVQAIAVSAMAMPAQPIVDLNGQVHVPFSV